MTLAEYLGLITSWHSTRPRFMNTVAALIQPLVDAQDMLAKLTADFDLDTAVGVQLDVVGQWIGRTRYVKQPIKGVFFSFDDSLDGTPGSSPRTGFDQGVWLGRYDPTDGLVALDDETYRAVLKLQAIANQWDGTLSQIADQLDAVFPGIVIQDLGDTPTGLMAMDILIPSALISSLLLAVLEQDFPIKPSGVRTNFIETTLSTQPIFAFDVPASSGGPLGGFDEAAWGIVVLTT
jgi:hypothetical protein